MSKRQLPRPFRRLKRKQDVTSRMLPPSSDDGTVCHSNGLVEGSVEQDVGSPQEEDYVIAVMEKYLRHALLLIFSFVVGTMNVEWSHVAMRLAEYLTVAWITCVILIFMTTIKVSRKGEDMNMESSTSDQRIPLFVQPQREVLSSDRPPQQDTNGKHEGTPLGSIPHPALETFHVISHETSQRIVPNHGTYKLENHMWSGQGMILIRTPDVDDPNALTGTVENNKASAYFRGKQRRFEFQFQLTLKDVPKGKVFFACELEEPIKMGLVQRAFVTAAMAFMKKMNNTFHYSITGQKPVENGFYEKPHMSFTVEGSMDRLVVTKPGGKPPTLGGEIYEDPESIKKRKKGGRIDWNTQDTYTFSLWSAYVDFLEWKSLNLPGIRPFLLSSVIGSQYMNLVLYAIDETYEKHCRANMNLISGLEICNTNHTQIGPRAKLCTGQGSTLSKITVEEPLGNDDDFDDELDDEATTVAELGEGLYLRSGDTVVLRESTHGDDGIGGALTSGGGFAIIQKNAVSTIVIEKARPSKMENKRLRTITQARQKLIKTGDTVLVKLVTVNKNTNKNEIRYLSIHRGWWLKWVTDEPTKNGYFTIHTLETEFYADAKSLMETSETQSSYLTLGGSFSLRHKRWGGYQVGVNGEESPTYGGRMLGIFSPTSQAMRSGTQSDDEPDAKLDFEDVVAPEKGNWLKPLRICAHVPNPVLSSPIASSTDLTTAFTFDNVWDRTGFTKLITESFQVDVPIWIEMMNRSERSRQLAYVVRVLVDDTHERDEVTQKSCSSFVRLRTGHDLAGIMRLGMSRRDDDGVSKKAWLRKKSPVGDAITPKTRFVGGHKTDNEETDDDNFKTDDLVQLLPRRIFSHGSFEGERESDFENLEWEGDAGEQTDHENDDHDDEDDVEFEETPQKQNKRRLIIGQIAKSVKSGTVTTGMQVMKQSKKAGKALVGPISRARPKNPPATEPKSRKVKTSGRLNRRREKDHHIVLSRTMKKIGNKTKESKVWLSDPPRVLAGQLSAPDQSCRMASHVLSRMSPSASNRHDQFARYLAEQIADKSDLDKSFLQGSAAQLGVVCSLPDKELIFDCLAARCLWDSHWREEWVGIYKDYVAFFAPLTNRPSLQLSAIDIKNVRLLGTKKEYSPLAGYPIAVIETAWQCYYAAFPSKDERDEFIDKLNGLIIPNLDLDDTNRAFDASIREKVLWKARFWQGFNDSAESTLSRGKRKWAKIPSGNKMLDRSILNGRRFGFDVDPISLIGDDLDATITHIDKFANNLLAMALSITTTSLQNNPGKFVEFLDMTSQLRSLPLQHLDLSRPEAFCIFVNIYHCLLQHSLVVTVSGPLFKKSVGHFMRTTCYEIGGDVFSLAELQHCVIRGKMTRPTLTKYPYLEAPRKSNAYHFYALDYMDPRVNFVLNTGDVSCPITIPVLQKATLEEQLNAATTTFIQKETDVDKAKGSVLLPKICDVYKYDFGNGDTTCALHFCLKYLDEEDQRALMELKESPMLHVKFQPCSEQYHLYLKPVQAVPLEI